MVDVLPAGVPRIACLAYRRLPCKSHARLGVQGGCATQRQNHEGTVAFDLVPGFAPPEELAAEAVLLLITLLARWRPDDEDRERLLLVDNPTYDPHASRASAQTSTKKKRRRPVHAADQRSTSTSKEPRDGGCPRRSSGRRALWQESPRAAITVSRTTLAPCPLTAPPRGRRRHTRHNDPGLQSVDLLRRHTEEQDIYITPIKTAVVVHRTRIVRKNGARQTSSLLSLGSAQCQNQCAKTCHRAGPEETTRYMPVQKVFRTSLDNILDKAPEFQVEEPTFFWTKLRSPSAQRASRGQRALGGPFFCMHLSFVSR